MVHLAIKMKTEKAIMIKATVTPQITGPLKRCRFNSKTDEEFRRIIPYLIHCQKSIETYTLGLLIGNDYYNENTLDERKKIQDSLYDISSKLGWIISGLVSSTNGNEKENVMFSMTSASRCLPANIHLVSTDRDSALFEPNIEELWNLGTTGIKSKDNQGRDDLVMQIFKNTITKEDRRFQVSWPWRSTTKVRVLYDTSAKTKRNMKSLNECLHQGPVILEDLCALLLRFMVNRIGIIADIEKTFLQVGLHQRDRDVTRFLWLKYINGKVTDENIQIFRFARLPFGIISSPCLLNGTVEHHLDEANTATAKQIKDGVYQDNVITGTSNDYEVFQLYKVAKKIFQEASRNLRDRISNSEFVNENTSQKDQMKERVSKVLGIIWSTNTDEFSISTKKPENIEQAKTKREVLVTLASIFDPLGIITPVTHK